MPVWHSDGQQHVAAAAPWEEGRPRPDIAAKSLQTQGDSRSITKNKPHSFEGAAVELINEPFSGRTIMDALDVPASPENISKEVIMDIQINSISTITGVKLLKGVEKSYDPVVKLLDESAKIKDNLSEIENRTGKQTDNATTDFDDVWSKPWGESSKEKTQQEQEAGNLRSRMIEQLKKMAQALGIDIDIIEDASTLKGKKGRANPPIESRKAKVTFICLYSSFPKFC